MDTTATSPLSRGAATAGTTRSRCQTRMSLRGSCALRRRRQRQQGRRQLLASAPAQARRSRGMRASTGSASRYRARDSKSRRWRVNLARQLRRRRASEDRRWCNCNPTQPRLMRRTASCQLRRRLQGGGWDAVAALALRRSGRRRAASAPARVRRVQASSWPRLLRRPCARRWRAHSPRRSLRRLWEERAQQPLPLSLLQPLSSAPASAKRPSSTSYHARSRSRRLSGARQHSNQHPAVVLLLAIICVAGEWCSGCVRLACSQRPPRRRMSGVLSMWCLLLLRLLVLLLPRPQLLSAS
jgi:hypothetical protein